MAKARAGYKKLDEWLGAQFKPGNPGISAIVVQDGQTRFRKAYGSANVELGVPLKPEMVFRLGSITKQFTAMAILMLIESGKLELSDKVSRYVLGYPAHWRDITIEHLLTHTSGVKNYTDMPESAKISRDDKSVVEFIDFFKDQPLDFEPGARWSYSNSGYFLLGAIIEVVSGQSYEAFLKQNIFDKLGMNDTHYDLPNKVIPRRVFGYSNGAAGLENATYISMTQPHAAGALASSVDDLAKWDAALYTDTLLKLETLQQAWTPHILKNGTHNHYGYGWGVTHNDGLTNIEHGGGIPGFSTFAVRVPEQRLYVAVLSNTNQPALEPIYVAWHLVLHALGKPYREPEPIALGENDLQDFAGQYKVNEQITITISSKRAQLFVAFWDGMTPTEIYPATANEFFMKNSFMRFQFAVDETDATPTLHIYDRGVLHDIAKRQSAA